MKHQNPAIPPGSIVVVLGANGYIAQETCHKLLEAGYRVRGTVRDTVRNAWAHKLFDSKFPGMFELVQVVDFGLEGAFDEAFKVISPDPAIAVTPIVNTVLNTLSAAAKAGITRFNIFNYAEVAKALNEPTVPTPERALTVYSAGRTSAELAFWDWVKENKEKYPQLVANSVVPDGNFGRVLEPTKTGTGPATSVGMLQRALRGKREGAMPFVGYLIDTQDTARLFVAALVLPSINNERIFAFYKHYTWNELRQRVRDIYPDRDDLVLGEDYDHLGRDMGNADELISRSEQISRQIEQKGFSNMDDLLKDYIESFYLKSL
ncbi:putative aldehyde reductase 2 [Aspergillus recurvatus]